MHPNGSKANRFETEVEINDQQLILTHQILKHGFLMCEEMINDGSPAAGEKEGITFPGKAVVWNQLGETFHTREQFPGRICAADFLSGAELVLRPIFNIIPSHKKPLNGIFLPMFLLSFKTFPCKFRIQDWRAPVPCLTECRKRPSGKKLDPCTIPALLFSRLSWCRRIHWGSWAAEHQHGNWERCRHWGRG